MTGPNWNLDDDLKTVTITFPSNPPVALRLSAEAVDDMLRKLGEFRAMMQPPIAVDHPRGPQVQAVPNPSWKTEPEIMTGATLIHMRDPRFGWLHYMIPKAEAAQLAGAIQKQVEAPQSAPKPDQIN